MAFENPLTRYRRSAIQAAKDLGYRDYYINRLKVAKTEGEICRIMITARKEWK